MRRKILIAASVLLVTAALGLLLIVASGPSLLPNSRAILDDVLESEPPEFVTGTTGIARSGDIDIWYESRTNRSNPTATVLLVMGFGQTALVWPEYFLQPLVDAGYQVVRYDNRGLGLSDWMEEWDAKHPYTLEDMARDGIAVLDALGVTSAHIVGLSMGGMIGQRLAISHADRVMSLTSISSSGYFADPELPSSSIPRESLRLLLRYGLIPTERSQLSFWLAFEQILKVDENAADVRLSAQARLYDLRRRNGFTMGFREQQATAMLTSGSRYDELGNIARPTLVVHGRSDPLILPAHAERYAPMIPHVRMLWIEDMGHFFQSRHVPQILDATLQVFSAGEGQTLN